jgi:hypothetical protein
VTIPRVPDFTTGVLDTSKLSALADAVRYALNPPGAGARGVAPTVVGGAGLGVFVSFDTEDFDNASMFAPPSTLITVVDAGFYTCLGWIQFAAAAAGTRACQMTVNGTSVVDDARTSPNSTLGMTVGITKLLAAGDQVQLVASQTSGGNLNVTGRLSVVRVSGS